MEPVWISLIASSSAAIATVLAVPRVRSILRTIFQRPRETSVIVEVGDKRVQLRGNASPEQIRRLVEDVTREQELQAGGEQELQAEGEQEQPRMTLEEVLAMPTEHLVHYFRGPSERERALLKELQRQGAEDRRAQREWLQRLLEERRRRGAGSAIDRALEDFLRHQGPEGGPEAVSGGEADE